MADGDSKRCATCCTDKARTEFGNCKRTRDGLRGQCKACRKIEQRDYYERNREKVLAKNARWAAANPDATRAIGRAWQRRWREADPAAARLYYSKYKTAEKNRAYARADYYRHQPKRLAAMKRWRQENMGHVLANVRTYRARKRGAEGIHTAQDIARLYREQRGRCVYCKKKLPKAYHIDHVVPLVKGGSNWPSNLQLLCPPCNLRKGTKLPIEFARQHGLLL